MRAHGKAYNLIMLVHIGFDKNAVQDHCHRERAEGVDRKARKKLIIASILCLFFMICEIIGGVLSNSLAIATDAAHLLTDLASFMISLFAISLAGRPSTQRLSFGWYRAEVLGALISVIMIWVITGILVWLAVQRVINQDFELNASIMLITSGFAILVNIIMGVQLQHGHSHGGGGGGGISHQGHTHDSHGEEAASSAKTKLKNLVTLHPAGKKPEPVSSESTTNLKQTHSDYNVSSSNAVVPRLTQEHSGINPAYLRDEPSPGEQMPGAGLQSFPYHNSQAIDETRTTAAAIIAETASGAHHHGGKTSKEVTNINVRAAFIHVIGDMVQSIGVFIAAIIIYFRPDWALADPICTFIFSIIVMFTTYAVIKDALLVLMEGTPNYMHYTEVLQIFQEIDGVKRVHNLRIWALSVNKVALSVHLAIAPDANPRRILEEATNAVHLRYNFFETTIQIEDFTPQMDDCNQCVVPDV